MLKLLAAILTLTAGAAYAEITSVLTLPGGSRGQVQFNAGGGQFGGVPGLSTNTLAALPASTAAIQAQLTSVESSVAGSTAAIAAATTTVQANVAAEAAARLAQDLTIGASTAANGVAISTTGAAVKDLYTTKLSTGVQVPTALLNLSTFPYTGSCSLPNVVTALNAGAAPTCTQPTNVTGNAATATSVASGGVGQVPVQSGSGATTFLPAMGAAGVIVGNGTSSMPSTATLQGTASQVTVTKSVSAITLSLPATINVNTSGTAATATAFDHTPTKCSAGNYPLGVDSGGNAQNCTSAGGGGNVSNQNTPVAGTIPQWQSSTIISSSPISISQYGTMVNASSTTCVTINETAISSTSYNASCLNNGVTGSSVTVSLVSGQKVELYIQGDNSNGTSSEINTYYFKQDGVLPSPYSTPSITAASFGHCYTTQSVNMYSCNARTNMNPGAGTHTYCLGVFTQSGTLTLSNLQFCARIY
jgi:hypothetical protein